MPAGREFDVRFPLKSDRRLTGPAGGQVTVTVTPSGAPRTVAHLTLHRWGPRPALVMSAHARRGCLPGAAK